jgi:hypothetical protein
MDVVVSNAERQAAWRRRRDAKIASLQAEVETLRNQCKPEPQPVDDRELQQFRAENAELRAELAALRSSDPLPVSQPAPRRRPAQTDAEERATMRKEAKLVRWIVCEMVKLNYGDGCQMTYPRHVMAGAPYEGADLVSLAEALEAVAGLIEDAAECVKPGALREQAASLRNQGHARWADDLDDIADRIGV